MMLDERPKMYASGYVPNLPPNNVTFTINGLADKDRVYVGTLDGSEVLFNGEAEDSHVSFTHEYVSDQNIMVRVRNSRSDPPIIPFESQAVITDNGLNMAVIRVKDA